MFAERGDEGGEFAKKKKGKSMRIKIRLKFFVGISIRVKEVERRDAKTPSPAIFENGVVLN